MSAEPLTRTGQPRAQAAASWENAHAQGTVEVVDLETLFDAYGHCCYGLARRILRDEHLAQDAVQEAFLEHWRSAAFDATLSTHRRWLMMLTHRKAVDRVRHEQLRSVEPWEASPEQVSTLRGPEDLAMANDLACRVRAALASLPPVQREAVELAYLGGFKQREIAEMTDTPIGTVKTRMRSGMIALGHALRDERDGVLVGERNRPSGSHP